MAKKKLEEAPKDEFVYARDTGKSMDTIKKEILDEEKAEKKENQLLKLKLQKKKNLLLLKRKLLRKRLMLKKWHVRLLKKQLSNSKRKLMK